MKRPCTGLLLLLSALPRGLHAQGDEFTPMPAPLLHRTPPRIVEMWRASTNNPRTLLPYLDRHGLQQSLRIRWDNLGQRGRVLQLHMLAVQRLGDVGTPDLIPALETYAAQRQENQEEDAATLARLAIERIRLRGQGRDRYVQAMLGWLRTPSLPEGSTLQQQKDALRRVIEGARALGVVRAVEAVEVLVAMGESAGWDNTHTGLYLARALARIGDRRGMGVLRRRIETFAGYVVSAQLALEPGEPDILWAYWVMRTQNRTQAEAIQEMIQSMADAPGLRAGHILEEIGKPAVPALIQAVTAPPLGQRPELAQGGAALILGNLRAVEAVSVLRNLLNTGSDSNRTIAAVSLGKIGDKSALDDLIRAVEDPDYEVRFSAISALGELKDARAETRLLRLARETQDGNLRFIAVGSLGKCGTSAILPALNDLLSSETEASIRAEIQSAINAISSR